MSATASSSTRDGSRSHSVGTSGDAQENVAPRQVSLGISEPSAGHQPYFISVYSSNLENLIILTQGSLPCQRSGSHDS